MRVWISIMSIDGRRMFDYHYPLSGMASARIGPTKEQLEDGMLTRWLVVVPNLFWIFDGCVLKPCPAYSHKHRMSNRKTEHWRYFIEVANAEGNGSSRISVLFLIANQNSSSISCAGKNPRGHGGFSSPTRSGMLKIIGPTCYPTRWDMVINLCDVNTLFFPFLWRAD